MKHVSLSVTAGALLADDLFSFMFVLELVWGKLNFKMVTADRSNTLVRVVAFIVPPTLLFK
jgi:hypothetical protein